MTAVQIIANPAVAIARAFTDTFAGIKPSSVPGFVVAELAGAAIGIALIAALYPADHPEAPAPLDINTDQDSANLDAQQPVPAARP